MAGKKSIVLLGRNGKAINQHFRYKKIRSAVRKSLELVHDSRNGVQIWHVDKGVELAHVRAFAGSIHIEIPNQIAFDRFWRVQ